LLIRGGDPFLQVYDLIELGLESGILHGWRIRRGEVGRIQGQDGFPGAGIGIRLHRVEERKLEIGLCNILAAGGSEDAYNGDESFHDARVELKIFL
jgi:hypothetical protein